MGKSSFNRLLFAGLVVSSTVAGAQIARAETAQELQIRNEVRERQAQMEQQTQAREGGPSPQVLQAQRWQQQWRQQHPNEPMPTLAVLEQLHHGEIINNINTGFANMRQARQVELQRQYQMSKQHQAQMLAAQHVTWNAQQWANWDKEYDRQQQQRANDYINAWNQSGEAARQEAAEAERRRIVGY